MIKKSIITFSDLAHRKVFGYPMGERMVFFVKSVSFSFFSTLIVGFIGFCINIYLGRVLGPIEYGKIGLLVAFSQVFAVLMSAGLSQSSVRSISKCENEQDKKSFATTAIVATIFSSIFFALILLISSKKVSEVFGTTQALVMMAIGLSIISTFRFILDGFVSSLYKFKLQSSLKIIEQSIYALAIICLVYFFNQKYFSSYYLAQGVASVVVILVSLPSLVFLFSASFEKKNLIELYRYGKYAMWGSILSLVFLYGDKIIVNKYLGSGELGIYSAYFMAGIMMPAYIGASIQSVLFPMTAKIPDQRNVMAKADAILKKTFVSTFFGVALFVSLMIYFYGNSYPLDWFLVFLFSSIGVFKIFLPMYASSIEICSPKTYSYGFRLYVVRFLLFLLYIFCLIALNKISIANILAGMAINSAAELAGLRYIIKNHSK